MHAISLFSNCGAGDVGYSRAGFTFDILAEIDPRRLAVASLNHPNATAIPGDLRATWALARERFRERRRRSLHLLAACPPCQGVSSARGGRGSGRDPDAGIRDPRNLLVVPIAKLARALSPKVIVVENVTAFLTRQVRHPQTNESVSAANLLVNDLARDYHVFAVAVDLADFGVPQHRQRCFLTFVRRDLQVLKTMLRNGVTPFPRPTHGFEGRATISLEVALERMNLPSLDAKFKHTASYPRRPLHSVPTWPEERYRMVAAIPANSGKGAWQNDQCADCGRVDVGEDDAMCPHCRGPLLRPVVKGRNGRYRLVHGFRTSSYHRMHPAQPASTITTASGHVGSDFTIHPWENRLLSELECAELQTIPRSFRWGEAREKHGSTFIREMIGEAVPPHFTERHGRVLHKLLAGVVDQSFLPSDDARHTRAMKRLASSDDGKDAEE